MGFISEKIDKIKYSLELDRITEGDEREKAIVKGKDFEVTVYNLFPRLEFDLFAKNEDVFDPTFKGSFIQTRLPFDFGFEHKKSGQRFYVECKYRSCFYHDVNKDIDILNIAKNKEQFEKYKKYSRENNVKVFIVVGVDGTPEKPKYMFCFPLEEIKYHTVYDYVCAKYERKPPTKLFAWRNGRLF